MFDLDAIDPNHPKVIAQKERETKSFQKTDKAKLIRELKSRGCTNAEIKLRVPKILQRLRRQRGNTA